jgi:hypothetical protein
VSGVSNGSSGGSSVAQIIEGVRKGMVPRQVRVFAAQGLLPVSREDLLRIQLLLTSDPDEEVAKAATESIKELEESVLAEWVKQGHGDGLELDLLVRVRNEDAIWAAAAANATTPDETLRVLAHHGSPLVQDVIITNQVRVMACLELLEDLRTNPQVSQVVLRRVREFEVEFIEKAAAMSEAEAAAELEAAGQSIADALAELKAIGAHIPGQDRLPYRKDDDDAALREAIDKLEGGSAFGRILQMDVKQKIICALKGSREERTILINSRNRLVIRAVLSSPKLNESEIERYASSRSVADEVIRVIASNHRWLRQYSIASALVFNPKTPIQTGLRLLTQLNRRDLARVMRDRNVNQMIRRRAKDMAERLR